MVPARTRRVELCRASAKQTQSNSLRREEIRAGKRRRQGTPHYSQMGGNGKKGGNESVRRINTIKENEDKL